MYVKEIYTCHTLLLFENFLSFQTWWKYISSKLFYLKRRTKFMTVQIWIENKIRHIQIWNKTDFWQTFKFFLKKSNARDKGDILRCSTFNKKMRLLCRYEIEQAGIRIRVVHNIISPLQIEKRPRRAFCNTRLRLFRMHKASDPCETYRCVHESHYILPISIPIEYNNNLNIQKRIPFQTTNNYRWKPFFILRWKNCIQYL